MASDYTYNPVAAHSLFETLTRLEVITEKQNPWACFINWNYVYTQGHAPTTLYVSHAAFRKLGKTFK